MKTTIYCLTLFLSLSIAQASQGQTYRFWSYYTHCFGEDCLPNRSTPMIREQYYMVDSMARALGIQDKVVTREYYKRGKRRLSYKTVRGYDNKGRLIKTQYTSPRYAYHSTSDYSVPQRITTRHSGYFKQSVYNDSNRLVSTYTRYNRKNNKLRSHYLTRYTYIGMRKNTTMHYSAKRKDTGVMRLSYRRYYQNDTGELVKMEYYRKGKVSHTYLYDCNLSQKKLPKKNQSTICQNRATDDRGYTFITTFSRHENRTIKRVSVFNAHNKLVERTEHVVLEPGEKLISRYVRGKDSASTVYYRYSSNYSKVKGVHSRTLYYNRKNQVSRIHLIVRRKGKVHSERNTYFKYYSDGLIRESTNVRLNKKGKIKGKSINSYYYSFR